MGADIWIRGELLQHEFLPGIFLRRPFGPD
jgi:hypothetical protein